MDKQPASSKQVGIGLGKAATENLVLGLVQRWSKELSWDDVTALYLALQNQPESLLARVANLGGISQPVINYFITKGEGADATLDALSKHLLGFGRTELRMLLRLNSEWDDVGRPEQQEGGNTAVYDMIYFVGNAAMYLRSALDADRGLVVRGQAPDWDNGKFGGTPVYKTFGAAKHYLSEMMPRVKADQLVVMATFANWDTDVGPGPYGKHPHVLLRDRPVVFLGGGASFAYPDSERRKARKAGVIRHWPDFMLRQGGE